MHQTRNTTKRKKRLHFLLKTFKKKLDEPRQIALVGATIISSVVNQINNQEGRASPPQRKESRKAKEALSPSRTGWARCVKSRASALFPGAVPPCPAAPSSLLSGRTHADDDSDENEELLFFDCRNEEDEEFHECVQITDDDKIEVTFNDKSTSVYDPDDVSSSEIIKSINNEEEITIEGPRVGLNLVDDDDDKLS